MEQLLSRVPVLFFGLMLIGCGVAQAQESALSRPPTEQEEIVHVLNRISFGPRAEDVEAVRKMGLRAYIEQQLHPETIDDSAVEQEVAQLQLVQMSAPELMKILLQERAARKLKKKLAAEKEVETPVMAPDPAATTMTPMETPQDRVKPYRSVTAIAELEEAKLVRAVDSRRQLQEVLVDFWTNHFNVDMKKGPCRVLKVVDDRDVIRPHVLGKFRDLLEASAKSPAMLFYLDNAENSVAPKAMPVEERMEMAAMEKEGDLADAPVKPKKNNKGGINENYAREIMELHTLGVAGGYTQKDVQEVARCFTGWTIDRKTGEFRFAARRHDNGEKFVLGHEIPPDGGMKDGEMVLDLLASAPATAHHISLELCERFVSDTPPEALVTRVAGVFEKTNGDLRSVTEAILTSPEFLSRASFQTKIKSPLEFAVSAVRATESTLAVTDPAPLGKGRTALEGAAILGREKAADRLSTAKRQSLNWHIYELGEPLFACTPPTGYSETSKIWVSPGALIERLNFALALTQQRVSNVQFNTRNILANTDLDKPDAVLNQCVSSLLQGNISPGTRKVLTEAALPPPGQSGQTVDPGKLIALILGSPEFQRK